MGIKFGCLGFLALGNYIIEIKGVEKRLLWGVAAAHHG
jgi:hypothetical protein